MCKGPRAGASGEFQDRESHCCWTQSLWVEIGSYQITENTEGHVGAVGDSGL